MEKVSVLYYEMSKAANRALLDGNYKVVDFDCYCANVEIDGVALCLWIANGWRSLRSYQKDCMGANFKMFLSDQEKEHVYYELLKKMRDANADKYVEVINEIWL